MIKTLARSIREYKKDTILTPVYIAGEVTMEVLIPLLMANLIDYGIDKSNILYINRMGIFLFMAALISLFFWCCFRKECCYRFRRVCKELAARYVLQRPEILFFKY